MIPNRRLSVPASTFGSTSTATPPAETPSPSNLPPPHPIPKPLPSLASCSPFRPNGAVDVALVAVAEERNAYVEDRRIAHYGAALPKGAVADLVHRPVKPARVDGVRVSLYEEDVAVAALIKGEDGIKLVVAPGSDDWGGDEVQSKVAGGQRGGEGSKVERHVREAAAQHGCQPRRAQRGAQLLDDARRGTVRRPAVEEEGKVRNWVARAERRQGRPPSTAASLPRAPGTAR
ncbi:hypothetical protein FGB62_109g10 [Gracilaria domingensis]|nr:hypothetical protein FGB62_109g10 [Gracilaria domingensis]